MKNLSKKINTTNQNVVGDYTLTRVIIEELNIGVTRYYICGCYDKGYFAAWNDERYFTNSDIETFDTIHEAWEYINHNVSL